MNLRSPDYESDALDQLCYVPKENPPQTKTTNPAEDLQSLQPGGLPEASADMSGSSISPQFSDLLHVHSPKVRCAVSSAIWQ